MQLVLRLLVEQQHLGYQPHSECRDSNPGILPLDSWIPPRRTRFAHLTFHRLGPLAQFHLQEVQGGDHGPDVADVGVFQLLCSQSRAGESSQGAEPWQRACSHGRVRDLPRHHSRRSSSPAWSGREKSKTSTVSQKRCCEGLRPPCLARTSSFISFTSS